MPINTVFPRDAMLSTEHAVVCLQIMPHEKLGTLFFLNGMLSCRISANKCVAEFVCHSRASCSLGYAIGYPKLCYKVISKGYLINICRMFNENIG